MFKKNICHYKKEDEQFIKKRLIYQAMEVSLLLVGAFVFYDIMKFYNKPILNFVRGNKYWYHSIRIILHILFVFSLDVWLRYIFAFLFHTPL